MKSIQSYFESQLRLRKTNGTFRQPIGSGSGIDFLSNDYLGISRSHELKEIVEEELSSLPFRGGTAGSRLLGGDNEYIRVTEDYLAKFYNGDAALVFSSGYQANMAVLSSVPQRGDTVFYDELSHACMKDGIRLSFAKSYSFKHNDLDDLEKKVERFGKGRIFFVVESVYSMDGDFVDLNSLVKLSEKYDAGIILDEAHTTAWYGDHGKGLAVDESVDNKILARIYTYGKGPGVHGAVVVGTELLKSFIINNSRPFIYTTAPPDHHVVLMKSSTKLFSGDFGDNQRLILKNNIKCFGEVSSQLPSKNDLFNVSATNTPIQSIIIPGNEEVSKVAGYLRQEGFEVRPVRSPTVKVGQERIRVCLHSSNTSAEITELFNIFKTLID
ncbi:aminotransferase class I/II-fold pyridoxal phosphate-dependent enzyme [Marinigracilibium pacificum]|uniref:Aminotransferase class I/II-fold pyridoxal phosphate-dependent enzyme n=1 Tax=Marinigracilibium pacificum TaxID=2729599 RepID=A0A848J0W7_9BACT|nr:aminotransferase class I/II-fold pyridoxal phosphate-dependent enzyme [Marinigracilibium pacificum]NMM50207.1 aminotransferase class I/II-fold pyridoxal phosphate-dependent enzyme [Marinigracilibium pacificum]